MTDRERWTLRGPVRSCRIDRTWYFRRCGADACENEERHDVTELDFRADGFLARQRHHNPNGSDWINTFEYDDLGRLLAIHPEGASEPFDQRYEYDPAGRLARVLVHAADGTERIAESWEYDEAGRKKKTHYVDLAAQRPNTNYSWGVEGTDTCYSVPGAATLTTLYNDRGQPAELLFHNAASQLLSRVAFLYDREGNLIEEAQSREEQGLPQGLREQFNPAQQETVRGLFGLTEAIRRFHRYDPEGRRIETCFQLGLLSSDRRTMLYNEHGDIIEARSEDVSREYGMDETGRLSDHPKSEKVIRSETRFEYAYDSHGNWVRKSVKGRAGDGQDFTPSGIEKRALTYF